MKFERIIGHIDPNEVSVCEKRLTDAFIELGASIDNTTFGSELGGDPLLFALIMPAYHILTANIKTAATDGKHIFWSKDFLLQRAPLTIRLTCLHEGLHALFMHPQRRGNRDMRLWNIAVDYIANGMILDDLVVRLTRKHGGENKVSKDKAKTLATALFVKGLGNFCTLQQCQEMFKDPNGKITGMENWVPELVNTQPVTLPRPDEERALTPAEQAELSKRELEYKLYYADPNLTEEMKRPEAIYDLLYKACPQCPECGKLGTHPTAKISPKEKSKHETSNQKQDQRSAANHAHHPQHQHGSGADTSNGQTNNPGNAGTTSTAGASQSRTNGALSQDSGCSTCSNHQNVLGFGTTLDEHMESVEEEVELAKRLADAVQTAKAMAGTIPKQLEVELGKLSKPRVSFPDVIRNQLTKSRNNKARNDWTKFRTKPMAMGMLVPKKKSLVASAICLLDTSASMSKEDMALGISQLQRLDDRAEITLVYCDSEVRWKEALKLRRCNVEELSKIKPIGHGGTRLSPFINNYEKELGETDFIVMVTDGLLDPKDIEAMRKPQVPVFWLITNNKETDLKIPFGRVLMLRDQ